MKLFQKFGTAAPLNPEIKRLDLTAECKGKANFERNKYLIIAIVAVAVIVAPLVYYVMKWVDSLPL